MAGEQHIKNTTPGDLDPATPDPGDLQWLMDRSTVIQ
jgi:hypothetical protein